MTKFSSLSDLLDDLIKQKSWSKKIRQHDVFLLWPEIVGEDIASRTSPHVVRGTVLWIKVSDSVWMQQLHLQKSLILDKIAQRVQGADITDLRFQIDSTLLHGVKREESPSETARPESDSREGRAFDEMLENVTEDAGLKQAVKKCWEKLRVTRTKKSF